MSNPDKYTMFFALVGGWFVFYELLNGLWSNAGNSFVVSLLITVACSAVLKYWIK